MNASRPDFKSANRRRAAEAEGLAHQNLRKFERAREVELVALRQVAPRPAAQRLPETFTTSSAPRSAC